MTEKLDPYAELGVSKDATEDEIKAAFRKRAKETHPDKAGGSSEEFERVKQSHLVLTDPERRKKYDETGDAADNPVKSVQQRAMELVGALIGAAIDDSNKDLEHIDIVADIVQFLNDQAKEYGSEQKKLKAKQKRAEKFAKKIKRKKGGENLVARMAETHARSFGTALNRVTEIIEIHKRAAEILSDYSYEFKPMPEPEWPTPPMMSTAGLNMHSAWFNQASQFGMKGTRGSR